MPIIKKSIVDYDNLLFWLYVVNQPNEHFYYGLSGGSWNTQEV